MPRPEPGAGGDEASHDVLAAVQGAIVDSTGRLIVGCSGGVDSMALLWAVHQLAPGRVVAAHVNHNVHPDADSWRRLVERFSRDHAIPFTTTTLAIRTPGNFEHNAREARHAWLAGLLDAGDWLLLAHHRNDQAETALLRLFQGRGSYGMPSHRPAGSGLLVRPLLGLTRSRLQAAAAEQRLPWVADPANRDEKLDRVWFRRQILPRLEARDPRSPARLANSAERERDREAAALAIARRLPEPLPVSELPAEPGPAAEILRWWLHSRGGSSPPVQRLSAWWHSATRGDRPRRALSLPQGRLLLHEDALYWCRDRAVPEDFPLDGVAGETALPCGRLRWTGIDAGARLTVRFNQPGLRMVRGRGTVSARSLLQSAVLPWERAGYPLICEGGELVCIPGVALASGPFRGTFEYLPRFPVLRADSAPGSG